MSNVQNRINNYFSQLEKFINKLPLTEKDKNYIWFVSYIRFYDELVLDEKGNTTYGIQTEWQLQRFIEQFKKNLQKSRLKAIEKWTDELNKIKPNEAISKIDKHLYNLKKKELLTEIGGESTNDWQKWLEKYLSNELGWQQKRLTRKPLKQEIKGFESKLTDPQISSLYEQMQGNYFNTSPENLTAFLNGGDLDDIVIKWIDKSTTRHEPNKSTIYEFLYLLRQYNYIESNEFDTTSSNPNNLYRKLETVFFDINNFPQSNPHNIQRNTDRQKELEIIIKFL